MMLSFWPTLTATGNSPGLSFFIVSQFLVESDIYCLEKHAVIFHLLFVINTSALLTSLLSNIIQDIENGPFVSMFNSEMVL